MDVSKNRGTPKSSIFNKLFHYKPSILGYHYFRKPPYGSPWKMYIFFCWIEDTSFSLLLMWLAIFYIKKLQNLRFPSTGWNMISNWLLFYTLFSTSFGLITNPTRSLFHQTLGMGKCPPKSAHRKISNKTPQIVMRWRNPYSMWEGKQMTNIGILRLWRWKCGDQGGEDMETSSTPKKTEDLRDTSLMATRNRASVHQLRGQVVWNPVT